ncbi:hypothetical protein ACGFXB_29630 [Streptomyces canus]|uniref:hypothetical protein n=1 Tax=Streptomyces canus TaxID=58343 RepID=UPI003720C6CA
MRILPGDWWRIEAYGPYDLLNGGGTGKTSDDTLADLARFFTPASDWPPRHGGSVDRRPRVFWLEHPALDTIELPLAEDLATLVGTRRRAVGTISAP